MDDFEKGSEEVRSMWTDNRLRIRCGIVIWTSIQVAIGDNLVISQNGLPSYLINSEKHTVKCNGISLSPLTRRIAQSGAL